MAWERQASWCHGCIAPFCPASRKGVKALGPCELIRSYARCYVGFSTCPRPSFQPLNSPSRRHGFRVERCCMCARVCLKFASAGPLDFQLQQTDQLLEKCHRSKGALEEISLPSMPSTWWPRSCATAQLPFDGELLRRANAISDVFVSRHAAFALYLQSRRCGRA